MIIGTEAGYVRGHVQGEDMVLIQDTPEQISAFVMKHNMQSLVITSLFDEKLIETSMGFLMYCSNQHYLAEYLLPVLVPMQLGEVEALEFVPYKNKRTSAK